MNKVQLALAGSITLVLLLVASNIWLVVLMTNTRADSQNELSEKDSQISGLQGQVDTLNENYFALNQTHIELLRQYEDLLFHYDLLNRPASNFTTIKDLQITLMTHRTIYYYKDALSGNVTMRYLNGTSFEGTFSLSIFPVSNGTAGISSTQKFKVTDGIGEFIVDPPAFIGGPAEYRVAISWIHTTDGFVVAAAIGSPGVNVVAK